AENGNLWSDAIQPAVLPRHFTRTRTFGDGPGSRRHHLRRAGRDGAARHEKARGVFICQPPGLRCYGHLRFHRDGIARSALSDAQSWSFDGGSFLVRRHHLRASPYTADRGIRRCRHTNAAIFSDVSDHRALVPWFALAQWVYRRISDPARDI